MLRARVEFFRYQQDKQVLGATDVNKDGLRGWVYFKLEIGEKTYNDMRVHVSQSFGTRYDARDEFGTDYENPIEVGLPEGSYQPPPWNTNEFRKHVECVVRECVGEKGRMISIHAEPVTQEEKNLKGNVFTGNSFEFMTRIAEFVLGEHHV